MSSASTELLLWMVITAPCHVGIVGQTLENESKHIPRLQQGQVGRRQQAVQSVRAAGSYWMDARRRGPATDSCS